MRWERSFRASPTGRAIADRHYNRQTIGAVLFTPPGRTLVLLTEDRRALWVTSWPFPEFVMHAWPGAWMNSTFRNEGAGLSSELIREAVAATRAIYGAAPAFGMVTFIDPTKVRHKRDPGRCYRRAGFKEVGRTKAGLIVLQILEEAMPAPEAPWGLTGEMAL